MLQSGLPILLLLAAGSGVAALIYEIVWFQLLELAIGSTALSLAVLLATFMGGTCLGSLILPRFIPRADPSRFHPLRMYAAIEIGIGLLAILVLRLMPFIAGLPSRGVVAAICLLPPTLLMGATLPILACSVEDVSQLGSLYATNIAGAVFGCLLAGFYLLPRYDAATAIYAAIAINATVAAIALLFAHGTRAQLHNPSRTVIAESRTGGIAIYIAIALSGLCALAAESIWTRILGLLLGPSVYTLSIIVAVFLTGLGIGSGAGALLSRTHPSSLVNPRQALGWCQLLLTGAIAWTAYNLSASLPYWPINPSISSNIGFNFQLDLDRAFWALLPPTLLWGASFPLALAAAGLAVNQGDPARLMSRVYGANTLGAIIGALAASLLLIPWLGSQHAQQFLIALSGAAAVLLLLPSSKALCAGAVLICALFIHGVPQISKVLIAHGRYAATWVGKGDIVYAGEGRDSSVAVSSFPNGALTFHVAGKIQASNVPRDMRLQRMLGHLTTLTVAHPGSVLVIGCGAGITAGAVSIDPRVARETIVEIEPLVPQAAATYFSEPNFDVLHNPKVQVRFDDGRHFVLTTKERFDGITVDPLDPWVKGAANLYTREFVEAMKQRLNPGGSVTMYIQLFETNSDAVKSAVATFVEVFPNATIWGNPYEGQGHDMVLLGQVEPLRIDLDQMQQRFDPVAQSLADVGMDSPADLFATYAGRGSDLKDWLRGAAINHDRNLRMQYLAGLGLNLDDSAAIYAGMLAYRRFPEDIFASAEGQVYSLREAIRRTGLH
jgi:spermidine synthase